MANVVTLFSIIDSIKSSIEAFLKEGLSISSIRKLLESIVKSVEHFSSEFFKGKDKKEAALDILDEIYLISKINIPILSQTMERTILRWIAGILINSIVNKFNATEWK